ncbi:unnamed protein product [Rotaria magnacalcarata]
MGSMMNTERDGQNVSPHRCASSITTEQNDPHQDTKQSVCVESNLNFQITDNSLLSLKDESNDILVDYLIEEKENMISLDQSPGLYCQQSFDRSNEVICVSTSDIDNVVIIKDDPSPSRLNGFNILPTTAINSDTSKKKISTNNIDEYSNDLPDDIYARDENSGGIEIISIPPDGIEANGDNRDNGKNEIEEKNHEIRRTILIAQQRCLKPLSQFLSYEFCHVPLSLCSTDNVDFFNQQSKATAMEPLYKIFQASFSSSCPISTHQCAIVIDGRALFETKPNPEIQTIREYAAQLLKENIRNLLITRERVDVVFDLIEIKASQRFLKINDHGDTRNNYQLRGNDRIETPFRKFLQSNQIALATCIRNCWMEPELIQHLPPNRLLIVGGPDPTVIRLKKYHTSEPDYLLESYHAQLYTRIFLHASGISIDECQNKVIINTNDIDVILIAIALGSSISLQHLIIKSKYPRAQENCFIDVKSIIASPRQAAIDPICVLALHALSGCDTTSFIRNISKEKMFNCFFKDPHRYSDIKILNCIPPPYKSIAACEQLLIDCYSFGYTAESLDELRALMADVRIKDRARTNVASTLPPSTSAFNLHCLRAARQIKIWIDCLDSNPTPLPLLQSGYENADIAGKFKIK